MKFVAATLCCLSLASVFVVMEGGAQERPATASTTDPRAGLKAGFRDAGVAAKNMVLVSSLPRPAGFFDPASPAGTPTPPETNNANAAARPAAAGAAAASGATAEGAAPSTPPAA